MDVNPAMWMGKGSSTKSRPRCAKENFMTQGASRYPIAQTISALMDDYGFTPVELVHALGYRNGANRDHGLRRLNLWLQTGAGHDRILKEISAVYPAHADRLEKAVAATKAIMTAEAEAVFLEQCKGEKDAFRPYLHAEGQQRVPNGICIFGITGGHAQWTTVEIPKAILALPLEAQLAALPELMAGYRRRYNGDCPFFCKLTGFKFVKLLDYYQFDRDGVFIEHVERPYRTGYVEVALR
jgi:hypothetical protein